MGQAQATFDALVAQLERKWGAHERKDIPVTAPLPSGVDIGQNTRMKLQIPFSGFAAALFAASFCSSALAQESPWSGNASIGLVSASGNTQSQSQNAEYGLRYGAKEAAWAFLSAGKVLQARSRVVTELTDGTTTEQTQTTAENYRANLRVERRVDKQNYFFANADFIKDLFASVRMTTSQTLGYGRRLLARDDLSLDLELGAGARQEQAQDTRETVSEAIGQLGIRFSTKWGERAELSELISVQYGEENTATDSQTRLKLSIVGSVWAQLGFDLRNNSDTGPDEASTDTVTSVSLLWKFGK